MYHSYIKIEIIYLCSSNKHVPVFQYLIIQFLILNINNNTSIVPWRVKNIKI